MLAEKNRCVLRRKCLDARKRLGEDRGVWLNKWDDLAICMEACHTIIMAAIDTTVEEMIL